MYDKLPEYDWLHLHHQDFTGQYGKFYRIYRNAPWYIDHAICTVEEEIGEYMKLPYKCILSLDEAKQEELEGMNRAAAKLVGETYFMSEAITKWAIDTLAWICASIEDKDDTMILDLEDIGWKVSDLMAPQGFKYMYNRYLGQLDSNE
ncbi:MAG: hypothetical protein AAF705_03385 [Bacteroidota bacterium]